MRGIEESHDTIVRTLRDAGDLRGMPDHALQRLAAHARRGSYRPGEMIEPAGADAPCAYIILSGCACLRDFGSDIHRRAHTPWHVGPGELLRYLPPDTNLEATERRTDAYRIPDCDLSTVEASCPELARRVQDLLRRRVNELSRLNAHLGRRDVDGALSLWLLRLTTAKGEQQVYESCTELAELTGSTRQRVSERLMSFDRHGWIDWHPSRAHRQRISIRDVEALRRCAGIEFPAHVNS